MMTLVGFDGHDVKQKDQHHSTMSYDQETIYLIDTNFDTMFFAFCRLFPKS